MEKNKLEKAKWALKGILKIVRRKNVNFFGVIIPYFEEESKYLDFEKRWYKQIKESLYYYKIPCLDLHGKFPDINDLNWRESSEDCVHPSKKGHKLMAESIYNYLMKNSNWLRKNR